MLCCSVQNFDLSSYASFCLTQIFSWVYSIMKMTWQSIRTIYAQYIASALVILRPVAALNVLAPYCSQPIC